VNKVMNLWLPLKAGNFLTSSVTVNFLRKTLLHGVSQSDELTVNSSVTAVQVITPFHYMFSIYMNRLHNCKFELGRFF